MAAEAPVEPGDPVPIKVVVRPVRNIPKGGAAWAFDLAFDLVQTGGPEPSVEAECMQVRLDVLIGVMPDWVAAAAVAACETLAARVRALRPAVPATLWAFCDDPACPNEHITEPGDCRRCQLPDDHPAVVRMRQGHQ